MNIMRKLPISSDTSSSFRVETTRSSFSISTQPSQRNPIVRQLIPLENNQTTKDLRSSQNQNKFSGASTEFHKPSDALYSEIKTIFWKAKEELFEDGMKSTFSRQIDFYVKRYGTDAVEAITCLIVYGNVDSEVAGEALRWLGRIEHTESYDYRLWLLERSLSLSSSRIRDGAILGIASMDDKHAIPYLKEAIKKEQYSELKVDMEQVLDQLES